MNINNIIKELIDKDLIYGIHKDSPSSNENDESITSIDTLIAGDNYYVDQLDYNDYRDEERESGNNKIDKTSPEDRINIDNPDSEDYPDTDKLRGKLEDFESFSVDALAWYRPFHVHSPRRWGIYITDRGLYYIAQRCFLPLNQKNSTGQPLNKLDILRQSFRLLYYHEYFHYITELAATVLELSNTNKRSLYEDYSKNIYRKPQNDRQPIEEALANAHSYEKFWRKYPGEDRRLAIKSFMNKQPKGYSAYHKYLRSNFRIGVRELSSVIATSKPNMYPIDSLEILFDYHDKFAKYITVPVYLVKYISDPKYKIGFIQNYIPGNMLIRSKKFLKDMKKLSNQIKNKLEKNIKLLSISLDFKSLNFKPLQGHSNIYRFRIDRNFRATLKPENNKWLLLRVGKHEYVDRNPI